MVPPMPPLSLAAASPWESFRPATCFPDDCFCEAVGAGVIRQPANAWSSLAFVAVALFVAIRLRRAAPSRPALGRGEGGLFVASLVLVGLGSVFYHASLTFVGQVVDVSGIYLVATFVLLHRLAPRWGLPPLTSALAFTLANAALMIGQVTTPSIRRPFTALLLASALVVEWRATRGGRAWLAKGAGLILLAGLIWSLDRFRLACIEGLAFQGHALWHILGALAAACLFRSYEDEARRLHAS
jgi:hypothetical protein